MKKWSFVALLFVGATILGATVFHEPLARAAQTVSATIIGPLDPDGNVRVHVAPPAPIISGGGNHAAACPDFQNFPSTQIATALSIHMDIGVAEVIIETDGEATPAVRFNGPAAAGNASIVLALSRPVAFNRIRCIGADSFSVSWVGG